LMRNARTMRAPKPRREISVAMFSPHVPGARQQR
jgi:hypothetical protein